MAIINKIRIGTTTYSIVDANRDTFASKDYVDEKVAGAGAGFTDAYKEKLDDIEADAQVNKIEKIKVNGVEQQIESKAVNLDIPFQTGTGERSAVRGSNARAIGNLSMAIGQEVAASGLAAIASGTGSSASGDYSLASGRGAQASAESSTAIGLGVTANNQGEVALGKYNKTNTSQIFSVGVGSSSSATRNAIEVYASGDVKIPGLKDFTKESDVRRIVSEYLGVTTQEVDNLRALIEAFEDQEDPVATVTTMLTDYQLLSQKVTSMDPTAANNTTNYPSVSAVLDYFNCTVEDIDAMFANSSF